MWEPLFFALAGGFGGVVRMLVTGKGLLLLPKVEVKEGHRFVNLGFLAPVVIGLAAGLVAPYALGVNTVMALLAGYVGADFIENLAEVRIRKFKPG